MSSWSSACTGGAWPTWLVLQLHILFLAAFQFLEFSFIFLISCSSLFKPAQCDRWLHWNDELMNSFLHDWGLQEALSLYGCGVLCSVDVGWFTVNVQLKEQSGQHSDQYRTSQLGTTVEFCCHKANTLRLASPSVGKEKTEEKGGLEHSSRLASPALTRWGWVSVLCSLAILQVPNKTADVAFPTQIWQEGKSSVAPAACWPVQMPALSSSGAYAHCRLCKQLKMGLIVGLTQFVSQFLGTLIEEYLMWSESS